MKNLKLNNKNLLFTLLLSGTLALTGCGNVNIYSWSEKDLQDRIEDANEQIDKNHDDDPSNDKPVNEDDLGHGVKFKPDYCDEYGNLDDYVENITTDRTKYKSTEHLSNPSAVGVIFDTQDDIPVESIVQEAIESPTFIEIGLGPKPMLKHLHM